MSPSSASPSPTASPRPQQLRVPDVLGDRQAAAEAALRAAGFAAAVQLVPAPSPRQARRVISQRPAPGQLAQPGSVVTLVVGDR
jgi:beta-lactam-binding protein with PASTA domain